MTALPDPSEFATSMGTTAASGLNLHPSVKERFWGYEVRMNQTEMTLGMLIRAGAGFLALVMGVAAIGLWVLPTAAGAAAGVVSKLIATLFLVSCAAIAAHIASQSRKVRVQVDTAKGELREVIDGRFGAEVVLARYGLDTVASVETVASTFDPTFGQVHLQIKGYGKVPVGDGAVSALRPLQDRLTRDCGLHTNARGPAYWAGALNAD